MLEDQLDELDKHRTIEHQEHARQAARRPGRDLVIAAAEWGTHGSSSSATRPMRFGGSVEGDFDYLRATAGLSSSVGLSVYRENRLKPR
jgi:hypothetical protein